MHGPLFSHTEAELIQAALHGDGSAFAELLRPHYQSGFRVAYGLLHDSTEAEDAVQEAAFKAWRRLSNLREGSSIRPWFLAIVANQCRGVGQSKWWSVAKGEKLEGRTESVDVAAAVDLRRALLRLSHDERLIVVLRYYLDMPFEEIATTLGITAKAARNRVERAVHRLRAIVHIVEISGAAV
jgi:RNA polymerase sigma-70 factor (ECF subfamily)